MKKNSLKILMIIIVLIILIGTVFLIKKDEPDEGKIENVNSGQNVVKEENQEEKETEDNENEVEEIKQSTGKTGDTELYEIQEGDGNIKIATIKTSVKYKVAFAGIIKNGKPEMQELDNIIEEHHPEYAGIYIVAKDRDKFLQSLEGVTNSKYSIDSNGYLKIENKDNQNENDKKLEKAINGENLYIINISSVCYIVDEITGEILDYSFENLDKYQTYEYFEDGDKRIIFVTENKQKQMENDEIINSVIDLIFLSN